MKLTDLITPGSVPAQTRDGFPVRMGPKVMPGPADTYVAYGRGWANVSNTPFREYKHWVHEGGISTPLIVHWPAGVAARGELRTTPGHLIDIVATIYDVADAKYPADKTPLEGLSLRGVLEGKPLERDALYWEHEGNRAVRSGDWKLVAKAGGAWELYDIAHDRVEAKNLAAEQPEKVRNWAASIKLTRSCATCYRGRGRSGTSSFAFHQRIQAEMREQAAHVAARAARVRADRLRSRLSAPPLTSSSVFRMRATRSGLRNNARHRALRQFARWRRVARCGWRSRRASARRSVPIAPAPSGFDFHGCP